MTRKMARIAKIDQVDVHPNADLLDICTVGGWKCVTQRNQFSVGDLVIYCTIDSWIPNTIAPFLSKDNEPREYNGVKGERLRTVKLRGTTSQGLLLKLEDCFDIVYVNGVACINITDSKTTRSVNDSIQDI
jgi:RNA ligase (TIGR02306 family)